MPVLKGTALRKRPPVSRTISAKDTPSLRGGPSFQESFATGSQDGTVSTGPWHRKGAATDASLMPSTGASRLLELSVVDVIPDGPPGGTAPSLRKETA